MLSLTNDELLKLCKFLDIQLKNESGKDFDIDCSRFIGRNKNIQNLLNCVTSSWSERIFKLTSQPTQNQFLAAFPNIPTVLRLLLPLPASVVSGER